MSDALVACCGIDCIACDMRAATQDPKMQQEIARWFKANLGKDIVPGDIGCTWCRGEREGHWSTDCWILKCCMDDRSLKHCSECPDFACGKLEEWAARNGRYTAALVRLRGMHDTIT